MNNLYVFCFLLPEKFIKLNEKKHSPNNES